MPATQLVISTFAAELTGCLNFVPEIRVQLLASPNHFSLTRLGDEHLVQ